MALGITDDTYYSSIAAAIRKKNGTAAAYTPPDMATAIDAITGPGASMYAGATALTPTQNTQVLFTAGKLVVSDITVAPIPENYGRITYSGFKLRVE